MTEGSGEARVVSLLPAGSEIVAALGAIHALVGVSHECDFPDAVRRLPRVTSSTVDSRASSGDIDASVRAQSAVGTPLFALDTALLARLAPTLLLTQTLCDVCAVSEGDVRRLVETMDQPPCVLSLAGTTLAAVWDDVRAVGAAMGRGPDAERMLASLDARLRAVHDTLEAAQAPRPRVAVIEWMEPLFSAGHWTPELVRRAGGVDVLARPGDHSVVVSMKRLQEAQPDVLLFAPCGFGVTRAEEEAKALLATVDWRWAETIEAWALDGNALTSRPGPRLVEAVEVMGAIFAPALFDAPDKAYARRLSDHRKPVNCRI